MNLTGQEPYQKHTIRRKKPGKDEMAHPLFKYGTDEEFLEWIETQPSIIDSDYHQYNPKRNIACHVRRQKHGAGLAIKPPYSAVPMTQVQHDIQTRYGEVSVLRQFRAGSWTDESAKQFFDEWVEILQERWKCARRQGT